jgi:hypothetical protein
MPIVGTFRECDADAPSGRDLRRLPVMVVMRHHKQDLSTLPGDWACLLCQMLTTAKISSPHRKKTQLTIRTNAHITSVTFAQSLAWQSDTYLLAVASPNEGRILSDPRNQPLPSRPDAGTAGSTAQQATLDISWGPWARTTWKRMVDSRRKMTEDQKGGKPHCRVELQTLPHTTLYIEGVHTTSASFTLQSHRLLNPFS